MSELRSQPTPTARGDVRRLALARAISVTGGAAAYTALMDAIFRATGGDAGWLSAALLATIGVEGLASPLGGVIADRVDRRRVMVASDLLGAGCFLAMALIRDPGALLAAAFVSAVVETPFWSASVAAIPNLVPEEDLAWANSLVSVGRNAGITIGPVIGGVLAATIGAPAVFVANAASFVISAVLVLSVRGRFAAPRGEGDRGAGGLRAGFTFLLGDRVLRRMTLAWVALVLGAGAAMVADRPLAEAFGAGSVGFGLLIGAWGLGSVTGSLAGRVLDARTEPLGLVAGTAVTAVAGLAVGVSPWFPPVLALSFLWGTGDAFTVVAEQGIVQRRTPDGLRSRVSAASDAIVHGALAVGFAAAGPLLELAGPQGVYAIGGATAGAAALLLLPLVRWA
ncbi:MAG TPA: MFS transporter, partial [Actinomycetota bacterium]|nr:MFS transporter [Actinomycetota bacterium]